MNLRRKQSRIASATAGSANVTASGTAQGDSHEESVSGIAFLSTVSGNTPSGNQSSLPSSDSGETKKVSKFRGFLINFSVLLFGIVIALLVLETGFRLMTPPPPAASTWSDRPVVYYMPESTRDNRDYLYPPEKPADTYRIIVVGDSFTFGGKGQFDDTFPKRLERMLNLNDVPQKVEVLNWGVPGFSTAQEIRLVRRALSTYQPDLIVLEVTLNDPELQPYRVTHSFQTSEGEVLFRNPIFKYWKSLGFLAKRIANTITQRDYKQYYFDLYEQKQTWDRFAAAVGEIKQRASSAQVPVLAMMFPLFSHRLDNEYPFRSIHEKIGALFNSVDIPLLDLYPHFRGIPPERLQMIPGKDGHPNEIANRIAADALYLELARRRLIPDTAMIRKLSVNRALKHPYPAPKKKKQ